jgi:hypothetical protein
MLGQEEEVEVEVGAEALPPVCCTKETKKIKPYR